MTLSSEELKKIESRNNKRKELRLEVSQGHWIYESFAFIEPDTGIPTERSCILVRRRSWFQNLLDKYGSNFLDVGSADGDFDKALQPAKDGFYIEAALNDPIEDDIDKLISEVHRLRKEIAQ